MNKFAVFKISSFFVACFSCLCGASEIGRDKSEKVTPAVIRDRMILWERAKGNILKVPEIGSLYPEIDDKTFLDENGNVLVHEEKTGKLVVHDLLSKVVKGKLNPVQVDGVEEDAYHENIWTLPYTGITTKTDFNSINSIGEWQEKVKDIMQNWQKTAIHEVRNMRIQEKINPGIVVKSTFTDPFHREWEILDDGYGSLPAENVWFDPATRIEGIKMTKGNKVKFQVLLSDEKHKSEVKASDINDKFQ